MPTVRVPSSADSAPVSEDRRGYALLGNPNTGKSTLFNALCRLRTRTANFPGSTAQARVGAFERDGQTIELVDLPGCYGLNLDRPESRLCRAALTTDLPGLPELDVVVIVLDAINLSRNLIFANQVLQQKRPAIVALNRIDLARRRGIAIDLAALEQRLGCPVVPVSASTGEGLPALRAALATARLSAAELASPLRAEDAAAWASDVVEQCVKATGAAAIDTTTDRLDRIFTHPVLGLLVFTAVMIGLFYLIFSLAGLPMDGIEWVFGVLGSLVATTLPEGPVRDLLVEGVVGGIAGTVVFLPQICLLFLLISLLEESGYLARAAFVMDRLLRRVGLPGQSFVPLLSAHACAIPAIMAARLVPDRRDRLATILVAPFMSCSARLPVYVLLIGILFGDEALLAGLAFAGCYVLGAVAALLTALVVRRTILPGVSPPMVLELPPYAWPSLPLALRVMTDRAFTFLRKAGTVIVMICIVLWWLGAYPHVAEPAEITALRTDAAAMVEAAPDEAAALEEVADMAYARHAKAHTFIGRIGRAVAPVFEPIGYDWQLSIGVLSSFLAREVFVSTMAVVLAGTDDDPLEDAALRTRISGSMRDNGDPVFTKPTAASLLVFYVLAMQCLPTLEVTRREAGSWKWAALQLVWMSALAYVLAFATYRLTIALGLG